MVSILAITVDGVPMHVDIREESGLELSLDKESIEKFQIYADFVLRRADELTATLSKCRRKLEDNKMLNTRGRKSHKARLADRVDRVTGEVKDMCLQDARVDIRLRKCKHYQTKEGAEGESVMNSIRALMEYRKGMSNVNEWREQYKKVTEAMDEILCIPREELSEENTCCICCEAPVSILTKPCNHMMSCETCAHLTTKCYVCRARIEQRLRRCEVEEGTKVFKC
ncbi:E3 ubiquitin-protein ligase XIAP-like [Anneissia japonica]|uniref:E3 ubiquitin-protein ligase XIAP-like n=1 Tax=Anneissia japonica TaxID=1529436 RepID=UPI001425558A|nr:E3 ubiquitin-protein ligase XIAP-like [Anneissia japonica]